MSRMYVIITHELNEGIPSIRQLTSNPARTVCDWLEMYFTHTQSFFYKKRGSVSLMIREDVGSEPWVHAKSDFTSIAQIELSSSITTSGQSEV